MRFWGLARCGLSWTSGIAKGEGWRCLDALLFRFNHHSLSYLVCLRSATFNLAGPGSWQMHPRCIILLLVIVITFQELHRSEYFLFFPIMTADTRVKERRSRTSPYNRLVTIAVAFGSFVR